MKDLLILFSKFIGENSVAMMGVFFISMKILLRIFIHKLAEKTTPIDNWPMYAWTIVDLALLSISIAFMTNLPSRLSTVLDSTAQAAYYTLLVFFFTISYLSYGLFLKNRQGLEGNLSPLGNWKLFSTFSCCTLCGAVPVVSVITKFNMIKPNI